MRLGELVSGDKKDVVITNRLAVNLGRIAIYGWHRGPGEPIQPLSTVHGANYADYSHGIRLVSEMALINGKLRSVYDILRDSSAAKVLSDEGPIRLQLGIPLTTPRLTNNRDELRATEDAASQCEHSTQPQDSLSVLPRSRTRSQFRLLQQRKLR